MPFLRNGRLLAVEALAIAVMALSGCGGGGGGPSTPTSGGGGGGGGGPPPAPPVAYSNLAPKAVAAATGNPLFARQHSGSRATLGDHLTVFMTSTGVNSSVLAPTVFQYQPAEINFRNGKIYPIVEFSTATSSNVVVDFDNNSDDTWRETRTQDTVASLTRFRINAVSNDDDQTMDEDESGKQVAHVTVFTDYDKSADANGDGTAGDDTDYMVVAVWDQGPKSTDDPNGHTAAGAVASGRKPFASGDFGTQASVSYSGTAGGKRFSGGKVTDFTTTVSLTATFSGTATISGTVADVGGGQKLKLLAANPDKSKDGGPFSGNTELFDENDVKVNGYAGKWGGAFYGATTTTTTGGTPVKDPPAGTAGTFGVSGGDPSDSILGVFLAHRQ